MAAPKQPASPALLQAVLRRDLPAVQALLQPSAGASLSCEGLGALHAAALADWGAVVPLLVAAGAPVDERSAVPYHSSERLAERFAPLGLSAEQLAALRSLRRKQQPPLFLALQLGALNAAAALLAAGAQRMGAPVLFDAQGMTAPHKSAWGALCKLPISKSAAAGSREAAGGAVPPLVQRAAALLVEARPLAGSELVAAHAAAAALAFPRHTAPPIPGPNNKLWYEEWAPPCPWLLQRLLQLHASGEAATASEQAADAGCAVLNALFSVAKMTTAAPSNAELDPAMAQWLHVPAAQLAAMGEALAQWLRVPAAQRLSGERQVSAGIDVCRSGMAAAALPALLELEGVRAALQQAAQCAPTEEADDRSAHALVTEAAATLQPGALDAVLAAGGAVTLQAVNPELLRWQRDDRHAAALRLLLSRGVPPVPAEVPDASAAIGACPIYALLAAFRSRLDSEYEGCAGLSFEIMEPPTDAPLQAIHLHALRSMEALADAGYRPVTFRNVRVARPDGEHILHSYYPPDEMGAKWELDSSAKWLWRAAQREPWSPVAHAAFPPAFRAAAHALLLAAHRTSPGPAGGGAPTLGLLPQGLLLGIIGQAAYPLSAWQPQMEGGWILRDLHFLAAQIARQAPQQGGAAPQGPTITLRF